MKLKKILAGAAAVVLALSLASCGSSAKKIESADDLADSVIGVQGGTTGSIYIEGDISDGLLGKATLQEFKSGIEAVTALKQGKIDAVVIDNEPAKVFVSQNEGLAILESPYAVEEYAIAIAKDNDELLEQVNTVIGELKEDGTLQQIIDKYIKAE